MNITLNRVNLLPVRTWKWFGVSGMAVEEETPGELAAWEPQALNLPQGTKQNVAVFNGAGQVEIGIGKDAEQFVLQNQNAGIYLTAEGSVEGPITVGCVLDAPCSALADYNTIYAKKNSRVTLVLSYRSQGSAGVFYTSLTKIVAEHGAHVRLVQVQLLDDNVLHFNDAGVIEKENTVVEVIHIELGAHKIFSGCKARLEERRSRFEVETIYLGDEFRTIDTNYVAQYIGKGTENEIHANGTLLDENQRIYHGTIDFLRGVAYSVGHENEYTLLLSSKVRSRTAPLILCGEEDVEGQHAASIGKIDPGKLFYLMSRGLSKPQAKQIVIEAQFTPVLEKIPAEAPREPVHDWLKEGMSNA